MFCSSRWVAKLPQRVRRDAFSATRQFDSQLIDSATGGASRVMLRSRNRVSQMSTRQLNRVCHSHGDGSAATA
jgi:hypothetical protein